MTLGATEKRLLRISKLESHELKLFREGVSVEAALTRSISDAVLQVAADRLILGETFLEMAHKLRRSRSQMWRPAIARYYYSMYHAMRSASYFYSKGDDYQAHSDLFVKGVPKDFPNADVAKNALKDARLLRNEADYDPYPSTTSYYRDTARNLAPTATQFVADCRQYLILKGNPYL